MNKYLAAALAVLFVILVLGSSATPSSAATPTPTETLRPIPPTPTSSTLYLRETPTPFVVPPADYELNFVGDPGVMADTSINFYRFINRDHLIDLIGSAAVAFSGLALLVKIIKKVTDEK